MADFDLFVIGAGSGGVRAARVASAYGARVAVAEEHKVGGTCVIRGCVPKKLLVYGAHFAEDIEDAAMFGWDVPQKRFDWPTLRDNVLSEVARLEGAYTETLTSHDVEIFHERAVLTGPNSLRLASGREITADKVLIATGARPQMPTLDGVEHAISSNEVFHLDRLPKRIVIVGGGYIAVEFAAIFNGLGSEVTLVYRGENILRGFDDDLRAHLNAEMSKRGVRILCGTTVRAVQRTQDTFTARLSDDSSVEVDKVMFALGRWPNVAGFGLEAAGVRLSDNRGIAVDPFSQTSVPHIYAIGAERNAIRPPRDAGSAPSPAASQAPRQRWGARPSLRRHRLWSPSSSPRSRRAGSSRRPQVPRCGSRRRGRWRHRPQA